MGLKVLCIDDTPDVRLLIRRLLAPDYQIVEAGDGLQGIEVASSEQPDLVLVDLHMPYLTGYEVATRIKSLLPHVPVVALTADVTQHVRERALASGCDGYISKPIDPDDFVERVRAFISGERELLEDGSFREAYQQTLVVRLEEKVRELTRALEQNKDLNRQNLQLLEKAERRAKLLEVGARVGRHITSILELDKLLQTTVDLICDEFALHYAGVFLLDESGKIAVLRAARGEAGAALVEKKYGLEVEGDSMVGMAIIHQRPITAAEVDAKVIHVGAPHLPDTRSEMALPLIVGGEVLGAMTVQSVEEKAFGEDDVVLHQIVADQLAVAIHNARLLADLERAHHELVRSKTYEAIANATGEAIHWVGNKAAPIVGSVERIVEDVTRYLCVVDALLADVPADLCEHRSAQLLAQAVQEAEKSGLDLGRVRAELDAQPLERLRKTLSAASIFEDLAIIESGAQAILHIKEDLIGPARQHHEEDVSLPELLQEVVSSMGAPRDSVRTLFADDLRPVRADRLQLGQVFVNLIKNALEAMEQVQDKRLFIWARMADEPDVAVVDIIDNGVGIPRDQIDKIWMAFYTTKGDRGGTGLGLPSCAQIVGQLNGRITLESEVGLGTTFSVFLPAAGGKR